MSRLLRLLLACLVLGLGGVVGAPAARACACGAAPNSANTGVRGETAFVVWDGTTERIDLVMSLQGPAPDAGWIMPTPEGTQLALGDADRIDRLKWATRERPVTVRDWTPRFPWLAGGRGVSGAAPSTTRVEKVTDIGPFRVSTLTGSSASSVNDWLRANGYPTRDDLLPTFQTYLDQGWRIQAVKLVPGGGQRFQRDLPAFRLTFDTPEPIYPIKLSQHARSNQTVLLHVAAPHRVDVRSGAPLGLRFAGTLTPADTGLATDMFVTSFEGNLAPASITDDYRFARAATDAPFVRTYTEVDHGPGEALGVAITLAVLVAVFGSLAVGGWRLARGPRA